MYAHQITYNQFSDHRWTLIKMQIPLRRLKYRRQLSKLFSVFIILQNSIKKSVFTWSLWKPNQGSSAVTMKAQHNFLGSGPQRDLMDHCRLIQLRKIMFQRLSRYCNFKIQLHESSEKLTHNYHHDLGWCNLCENHRLCTTNESMSTFINHKCRFMDQSFFFFH